MAILSPGEHAGAIVAHYLKHLTAHAGLGWSEANDRDMATLASLLDQAEPQDDASDTIPPYQDVRLGVHPQFETRVTRQLDQDAEGWAQFRRWQALRRAEDEARP